MPQVLLYPAALISLAVVLLSIESNEIPAATIIGATVACFVFYALIFVIVLVPMMRARQLQSEGVHGAAIVKSLRSSAQIVGPLDRGQGAQIPSRLVTIEFTPEGSPGPILVELTLTRPSPILIVGKTVKIRYARSQPRLLMLAEE